MPSITRDKSVVFALEIVELCKRLRKCKEWIFANQVLKSGTSIGANLSESYSAQSKADFLSKVSIALKEAQETAYWLTLIEKSRIVEIDVAQLQHDCIELIRLLTATVKTTKINLNRK